MSQYICKYCGSERVSKRALTVHSQRCSSNPERKIYTASAEDLKERDRKVALRYASGELKGSFTGRKHSEESRKKTSESMKGNQNANHRGDRQTRYKNIRMDSRWEAAAAYHFDKIGASWVYNERGFKLSDGRYYYPDFFLYKKNGDFSHLIEVKGYFREANKAKFEQFRQEYPEIHIVLWFQDKLTQLGLLDCSGYSKVNGE